MNFILPNTRPQMGFHDVMHLKDHFLRQQKLSFNTQKYPLYLIGIRGYYRQTMGDKTQNDLGLYDDAIFICTPDSVLAFNANTDPSRYKPNMATLVRGLYYAHHLGLHKGKYLALCQRAGSVTVARYGQKKQDIGYFGINIHKGGITKTNSEGCQTISPQQWQEFIETVQSSAQEYYTKTWKTHIIPYFLIENIP